MDEIFKIDFLSEINYVRIFIDIILLFFCTKLIEIVYNKYIFSNDNKKVFSKNMFPFVLAMFLIVSVIKSSIALSLGLVGALSIIRFRTAIKEPGQLINLLILTSLSISLAAEKEILGIIITIIYCLHSVITYKENNEKNIFESNKILRISFQDKHPELNFLIGFDNIQRIYKDVNQVLHVEYLINDLSSVEKIIEKFKKEGDLINYEII